MNEAKKTNENNDFISAFSSVSVFDHNEKRQQRPDLLVIFRRLRSRSRRRRRRRTMTCPTLRTSLRIAFYTTLVTPPLPSVPSVLNSPCLNIWMIPLKPNYVITSIVLCFFTFPISIDCCYINEWHLPSWSQFSGLYSVASLSYSTSAQYKVSSFHESK